MSGELRYLVSGHLAYQVTREQVSLPADSVLTVRADTEEGSVLYLLAEDTEPVTVPFDREGRASVPAASLPEGGVRVLFLRNGKTVDGGTLNIMKTDSQGGCVILPALMANAVERERFAAMMANILLRLKAAEEELDRLKNGADILELSTSNERND